MSETKNEDYRELLRAKGLKATTHRLHLLAALEKATDPLGTPELQKALGKRRIDTVTIYRALDSLVEAGIVRQVDLRHGHADYELVKEGKHHHHMVCNKCGVIADISWCPDPVLEKRLLTKASGFATLSDHSLEFFGLCNTCV